MDADALDVLEPIGRGLEPEEYQRGPGEEGETDSGEDGGEGAFEDEERGDQQGDDGGCEEAGDGGVGPVEDDGKEEKPDREEEGEGVEGEAVNAFSIWHGRSGGGCWFIIYTAGWMVKFDHCGMIRRSLRGGRGPEGAAAK